MTMLAEQPILVSFLLGVIAATLIYVWSRGMPKAVGIAGLVALALIPVAWLIASLIETDEESIRKTISELAAHVQANEIDLAVEAIDPSLVETVERARTELARYEFTRARAGSYNRFRILSERQPKEAVVDLLASVKVSAKGTSFQDISVARRLFLHLRQTDDGWRVIDYEHRPAVGGPDGFSTASQANWEAMFKGTAR